VSANQTINQRIPLQLRRAAGKIKKVGFQAAAACGGSGEAGMVRLQSSECHHFSRPSPLSVSQQVLQLACLVTSQPGTDAIIAFDVNFSSQISTQTRQSL
jgi:hypothetical protein